MVPTVYFGYLKKKRTPAGTKAEIYDEGTPRAKGMHILAKTWIQ